MTSQTTLCVLYVYLLGCMQLFTMLITSKPGQCALEESSVFKTGLEYGDLYIKACWTEDLRTKDLLREFSMVHIKAFISAELDESCI